jgi:trimethylamine--corrinoid protein Co-methyltransferase
MIPCYAKLLTEEQVKRTHEASLEILEAVGLEVHNGRAREVYRRHGCQVDDDTMRVTLPPKVVEEFVRHIPSTFTFRARKPEFDRTLPADAPLMMTASSAPHIIDPVSQKQRFSTSADIARIACLVNELPGVDLFSVSVLAEDAPQGQYSLTRFYTALKYCAKPVRGSGDPGIDTDSILKLAYAIAGSESAYKDHPFITHHYCPIISPLKMDENSTELLMFFAEQGLPSHPTVVPNAGLTSPMTLAGTLAQGNAEFLSLAALTQMVKSETPMLYSSLSTVGDMRSGAYAPGGVECGMLNMAHAQMARFYNVPCAGYIGLTNSKIVDAQAGYEKAMSCMGGLLAGMHVLQFVGLIDALMAFDFGMAVVDNEISLMLKRVARGMEFSDENLAIDEVQEVGPAGMFLTTGRTFAHMADAALLPEIADRQPRQFWNDAGCQDAQDRALAKVKEILKQPKRSLFDQTVEERIRDAFPEMVGGDFQLPDGW